PARRSSTGSNRAAFGRHGSLEGRTPMKRELLLLAALAALFVWAVPASAGDLLGFTEEVSPEAETNATEPYIAIDHADGTVWVAWQASGTHVARSDDGGRSFVQTPIVDLFGNDIGDVDIAVGGLLLAPSRFQGAS